MSKPVGNAPLSSLTWMSRRRGLALAAVATVFGLWYSSSRNEGPIVRLVAEPTSVSFDVQATRLTAIVNVENDGERPTVAAITNAVFVDSQKQMNDASRPQTRQMELTPKQSTAVAFVLEGEPATAVWRGVQLMEVTITAHYRENAQLHCAFSFMGRFYPEIKKMGKVSSTTSPPECERR
jgi:ABC-type uncharacterized transport system ATPase subunit